MGLIDLFLDKTNLETKIIHHHLDKLEEALIFAYVGGSAWLPEASVHHWVQRSVVQLSLQMFRPELWDTAQSLLWKLPCSSRVPTIDLWNPWGWLQMPPMDAKASKVDAKSQALCTSRSYRQAGRLMQTLHASVKKAWTTSSSHDIAFGGCSKWPWEPEQ